MYNLSARSLLEKPSFSVGASDMDELSWYGATTMGLMELKKDVDMLYVQVGTGTKANRRATPPGWYLQHFTWMPWKKSLIILDI